MAVSKNFRVRAAPRLFSWIGVLVFLSLAVLTFWAILDSSVRNKVAVGSGVVGWLGMLGLSFRQLWLASFSLQIEDDGMRVIGWFYDHMFRWDSVDEVSRICNALGSGFYVRSRNRSVAVPFSFFEERLQLEEIIRKHLKERPMRLPFSWRPILTPMGHLLLTASVFLMLFLSVFNAGPPVAIGLISLTFILQFSLDAGQHELTNSDVRADQFPLKLRRLKFSSVRRAVLYQNPNNGWETLVLVDENHTIRFKSQMTPSYFQVRDFIMERVKCPVERVTPNR